MEKLNKYREEINKINSEILNLLKKRLEISKKVGEFKKECGLPVLDEFREKEILESISKKAESLNLNSENVQEIFKLIMQNSKEVQK